MPLLRYFMFVGGALLALLLIVAWASPTPPVAGTVASGGDVPPVRILSDRKWPERIVLDTSQQTITPPVLAAQALAPVDMSTKTRAHESYAQLVPSDQKPADAVAKKPQSPKRRVARSHPVGRPMMMVQQPRYAYGWYTMW